MYVGTGRYIWYKSRLLRFHGHVGTTACPVWAGDTVAEHGRLLQHPKSGVTGNLRLTILNEARTKVQAGCYAGRTTPRKSGLGPCMSGLDVTIHNEFETTIKRLRSDNGSEFKNTRIDELCDEFRIRHQFSAKYTPQSNDDLVNAS